MRAMVGIRSISLRSTNGDVSVSDKTYGFETLSVHAGAAPDPATGARALPIYQTTAYVFEDADHAAALFNLQTVGFIYSRLTNPTNAALETRLATPGRRPRLHRRLLRPCRAGARPLPADVAGRGDRGLLAALWRLAAADAQHLSEVRLGGEDRRRRRAGEFQARGDGKHQGVLHREPGQSGRRHQRHRGDRAHRRAGRRAAAGRQHAGHALALQADRLRRDPDRALDHQVPERHRHLDGRRGGQFGQVRLDRRAASSRASPGPSPPITG